MELISVLLPEFVFLLLTGLVELTLSELSKSELLLELFASGLEVLFIVLPLMGLELFSNLTRRLSGIFNLIIITIRNITAINNKNIVSNNFFHYSMLYLTFRIN